VAPLSLSHSSGLIPDPRNLPISKISFRQGGRLILTISLFFAPDDAVVRNISGLIKPH
jgi:hypothetical protein